MDRTLTLHVGRHKTGSTYLQRALCEAESALSNEGFYYPKEGREFLYGHHRLVKMFSDDSNAHELAEIVAQIKRPGCNVILSSENWSVAPLNALAHLRDAFSEFTFKVVLFLRARSSLIYSQWQENVKQGKGASLEACIANQLLSWKTSALINNHIVSDHLRDAFGMKSLIIFSYDNIVSSRESIVRTFLKEAVGVAPGRELGLDWVNRSLSPLVVAVLRCLNLLDRRFQKSSSVLSMRQRAMSFLNSLEGKEFLSEAEASLLPCRQAFDLRGIDALFSSQDDEYLMAYGDRVRNLTTDGKLFAALPDGVRYSYTLDFMLSDHKFIKRITSLYEKVCSD